LFGGLPRLIPTRELRDFWHTNRARLNGFIYDLPAGRTTLKRARQRLGFNSRDDISEFWTERIEDLELLSAHEFAATYGVCRVIASSEIASVPSDGGANRSVSQFWSRI
jgi:hypothetical protein